MAAKQKPEEPKAEKKQNPKKDKSRLDISMRAIADNIVFSEKEQWAYYRLNNIGWDFLSREAKYAVGQGINNALVNIMGERSTPLDFHLIETSTPYDLDMWDDQISTLTEDWQKDGQRPPGYERYMREQHAFLAGQNYVRKITYLGVKLGSRGTADLSGANVLEMGWRGALDFGRQFLKQWLGVIADEVTEQEEKIARQREMNTYLTISTGNLQATRATTEELVLLIKRELYPDPMPTPYLSVDPGNRVGLGDVELEFASAIDNCQRFVRINQLVNEIEMTGYRATMSITKLPPRTFYPDTQPFLYFLTRQGSPYTSYARFTMHPSSKMEKEIEKKKKEQKDEWDNIKTASANGGSELDTAPAGFVSAYSDLQTLEELVAENKQPWVEGHYRIVIEAANEVDLRERVSELKQNFADIEVTLNLTTGDQAELMLEQMPGDHLRMASFKHMTNLEMLGTAGFNFSPDVGDLIRGND